MPESQSCAFTHSIAKLTHTRAESLRNLIKIRSLLPKLSFRSRFVATAVASQCAMMGLKYLCF